MFGIRERYLWLSMTIIVVFFVIQVHDPFSDFHFPLIPICKM